MCGLDYTPLGKQSPILGMGEGEEKADDGFRSVTVKDYKGKAK